MVQGYIKYLVYWKRFIIVYNTWEKKADLENAKEVVAVSEGKIIIRI